MMNVLKVSMGLFSVVSLFITMIAMLVVGAVAEGLKYAFEKVGNYKVPKLQYDALLRNFRSHSKPAYYS